MMRPHRLPAWLAPAVLACAAAKLAFHLATAGRYGIFRDEMYVVDCGRHLAWGYVDCPPLGILLGWIGRQLFGTSLLSLRALPALAGAVSVCGTALLARELGGKAFAQGLAALAFCVAPIYLLFAHWLTINAFEPLFWIGVAWFGLRAINRDNDRHWLGFGVMAGLGIETKYSIIFLIAGIAAGLALTPQRRFLRSRYFWGGLAIAGFIALPNFLWQMAHGFPFLELRANIARTGRDVVRGPVAFLLDQAELMNPALAPLWGGGLLWLLAGGKRQRYGFLGWTYLIVLGAFILAKGKDYYVTPVYPILLAAGAVGLEELTSSAVGFRWRFGCTAVTALSGLVLLPLVTPVLSPENFLRYQRWTGLRPVEAERSRSGPLPQYFADEFGWEDMVREVARIYHALPPGEQARTAIFSNDWGAAAAVDYFGPKYGLPAAISKSVSYWIWGPRDYTGESMIILHTDGQSDRKYFASVEKVGRVESAYSRREEWYDIYLCQGLNTDLRELWPQLKSYY